MCMVEGKRPVPTGAYVLSKCLSVCASWKMWFVRDHEVYEFEMFPVERYVGVSGFVGVWQVRSDIANTSHPRLNVQYKSIMDYKGTTSSMCYSIKGKSKTLIVTIIAKSDPRMSWTIRGTHLLRKSGKIILGTRYSVDGHPMLRANTKKAYTKWTYTCIYTF